MRTVPSLLLGVIAFVSFGDARPHSSTGVPLEDFSPAWQNYFLVKDPLPNVTETLPRSFAGNVGVNRPRHPNNTLFFWGFEREAGSLTAAAHARSDEPWLIWLNGGPGGSSLYGLLAENGPLQVQADSSLSQNPFAWNKLADSIWVDQPVGVGYSTSDARGYAADEDQVAEDFLGFLTNLVKVFPSLARRPLILSGQSYAGVYIPYIMKSLFSTPRPPVKLSKIAIGDGTIGSLTLHTHTTAVQNLKTYPHLINFDQEVFNYFHTQAHLCGYDLNLTYPQHGIIPTVREPFESLDDTPAGESSNLFGLVRRHEDESVYTTLARRYEDAYGYNVPASKRELDQREERRQAWKRDLSGRVNGSIDPWYECALYMEVEDYATNFSFPWTQGEFNPYDIPDALKPKPTQDLSTFLNDNRTRAALHAPTSKNWTVSMRYPFGSKSEKAPGSNRAGDPSPPPMNFMTELATNATAHGVHMVLYSANDDALVAHFGTEVVIQNMTFGGIQGFTRKPSTPWFDDNGRFAGIVHQERNVTYVLFQGASHAVPRSKPEAAFVFLREFVLGSNPRGLVRGNEVVGGEDPKFADGILPGDNVIFYGSGSTAFSTSAPTATLEAWSRFIATAAATPTGN